MSVQWDPPTDNGGRDDLTYTVTISPLAQLSATVVTSTSVTVSAADYNEDYNVSVVATNCAGNSTAEEYSFRVGELEFLCGKSLSVCLQSSVCIVNEFHPHIGFVGCYPLTYTPRVATAISYLPSNLPLLPHTC